MYDIAILGLGPAGATLARLLDQRFCVVAIDKKAAGPESFHKPCGGLLAPDAQKVLAGFDLTLPKEVLVDPQIFSVRTIDLDSGLVQNYQRFYLNLNRHAFDLWMESLIPGRVNLLSNAECVKLERQSDHFLLTVRQGGALQTLQARCLIGADGANSLVRRTFFPHRKIRAYVSIQQWFAQEEGNPFYSCVFDSKATDCYSWALHKDGYFLFGGAYPFQDCRRRFEEQKERLKRQGFSLGEPLKTEACQVLRPASFFQFCTGEDGVFLIGEAAGFISPSSLEGISSAMSSAALLGDILNSGKPQPEKRYRRKTRPLRWKLTAKLLKCPFMYVPFLRRWVMKSGLTGIQVRPQAAGQKEGNRL